jgi:RHS repeat-associated protein
VNYVLQDAQGSSRAITNNVSGSSTIVARHDYLPFEEGIPNNTGLRSSGQGYDATDKNRIKYGLTECDNNGLNHTCWRKHDSISGRWTTPDPYLGSITIGSPQSFNRYIYSENDPVNLIDPSGLQSGGGGGGFTLPPTPRDPNTGLPPTGPIGPDPSTVTIGIPLFLGGVGGRGFGDALPEEFGELIIDLIGMALDPDKYARNRELLAKCSSDAWDSLRAILASVDDEPQKGPVDRAFGLDLNNLAGAIIGGAEQLRSGTSNITKLKQFGRGVKGAVRGSILVTAVSKGGKLVYGEAKAYAILANQLVNCSLSYPTSDPPPRRDTPR